MKRLENKETTIPINNEKQEIVGKVDYVWLIRYILNSIQPPFTPAIIRQVNKIDDALTASNGEIILEDEWAKFLKAKVDAGLPIKGKDAEQFLDDFDDMMKQK